MDYTNLFKPVLPTLGFSFSIRGISASELASNIEIFWSPLPLATPASISVPIIQEIIAPALLSGVKRDAVLALGGLGKWVRSETALVGYVVPFELPFVAELALPHEDGKIKVSPANKRKVGRLV